MKKLYSSIVVISMLLLVSCVPQKQLVYMQSANPTPSGEYPIGNRKNIRIEPFDELYILVSSLDQPGYNFLKQDNVNNISISEASIALTSYTVSDSGWVLLPVLGKIKLQGLTLEEASQKVKETAKNTLNNPTVSVRFVNNSITILGEVQHPGTYTYLKQQMNIFRALGIAGDITEYGNRRKVVIIRENEKAIRKYQIDLTKDDIITSEFYYVRPNDVIYVEPLKRRWWGMKEFPFMLFMAAITNYVLILDYNKMH